LNVVADTHAWVWWIMRSGNLSKAAEESLSSADKVLVCAISLWEVAMLMEKGRIPVRSNVRDFLDAAIAPGLMEVVPITPAIAARSNEFGSILHGDPADRLIAATALELSIPLVTRDLRLTGVSGLRTIW